MHYWRFCWWLHNISRTRIQRNIQSWSFLVWCECLINHLQISCQSLIYAASNIFTLGILLFFNLVCINMALSFFKVSNSVKLVLSKLFDGSIMALWLKENVSGITVDVANRIGIYFLLKLDFISRLGLLFILGF